MTDRESALNRLAVGDIFHARASNGASLICLVTATGEGVIHARRIHTQDDHTFDRNTGFECGKDHTKIDCVTPFPHDVQKIFVEMDKKYQTLTELDRQGVEPDPLRYKLTPDERRANLAINPHVADNPI